MTRARRLLLVCASLIGLLIIAAIALTAAWRDFRQAQGIEQLDCQGLHLGPSGLRLTRLQLVQRDPSGRLLKLDAQDLRLGLADWRPHRLQIAQLALDWQPASSALQPSGGLPDLSDERLRALASWLPRQVEIASLQLELPCASGRCEERGALLLRRAGAALLPASGSLTLYPQAVPGTHRLQLQVDARAQGTALLLELGVLLDDTQRLSLQNRLQPSDGQLAWDGAASLGQLPEAEWLLPWLCRWAECQAQGRLDLPGEMHLGAAWALRLPDP
ncbi:intermembrane phospholipid transport protein YdbH family protein, partial [Stutzerimonas balearica]|uniref:intermembrane phospholipid transport protein YdbH family protein n=1 Tax=Stutzerimonas balearica TaxID=74829 RepID=UPI00406BA2E1